MHFGRRVTYTADDGSVGDASMFTQYSDKEYRAERARTAVDWQLEVRYSRRVFEVCRACAALDTKTWVSLPLRCRGGMYLSRNGRCPSTVFVSEHIKYTQSALTPRCFRPIHGNERYSLYCIFCASAMDTCMCH